MPRNLWTIRNDDVVSKTERRGAAMCRPWRTRTEWPRRCRLRNPRWVCQGHFGDIGAALFRSFGKNEIVRFHRTPARGAPVGHRTTGTEHARRFADALLLRFVDAQRVSLLGTGAQFAGTIRALDDPSTIYSFFTWHNLM